MRNEIKEMAEEILMNEPNGVTERTLLLRLREKIINKFAEDQKLENIITELALMGVIDCEKKDTVIKLYKKKK